MDNKLMRRAGYVVIGSFALFNLISLLTLNIDEMVTRDLGEYSIFASKEIFYAYHIWGIIIPIVCIYALVKEARMLFFISLLILLLLQFYPVFTSGPSDIRKAREKALREPGDSLIDASDTTKTGRPAPEMDGVIAPSAIDTGSGAVPVGLGH